MRRPRQHAFTLVELLLVIALIGVLVAFAWPQFATAEQAEHLRESARRMEALLAMCRAEAMNNARTYRVAIRPDGSVRVQRQFDPLYAPHLFVAVDEYWSEGATLLEDVWVEGVELLPEGPPPYQIIDQELILPEMEVVPTPIEEFEREVAIDFLPDGSCPSLRWVLRDTQGRALLQTLDGRLGRVQTSDWEHVAPEDAVRPEPVEEEDEQPEYDLEDFKQRR